MIDLESEDEHPEKIVMPSRVPENSDLIAGFEIVDNSVIWNCLSPDYPDCHTEYEEVYNIWAKKFLLSIAEKCRESIRKEIELLTSYGLPFLDDPEYSDYRKSNSLERILEVIKGSHD
jgi:hypothetical protein